MLSLIRNFLKEEDGLGTVEIVVIVAVLVGIALIFRKAIFQFVTNVINGIFEDSKDVTGKPSITVGPGGISGTPQ